MKKILFLGASYAQIPIILEAKERDYYVYTCDYLPDNPGHKLANEYYNVSTTDQDGVLALAKKIKPDLVVAYASDPSAPTAAYVAEQLALPGNPYKSVQTLAEKDKFRRLQVDHGFNSPKSVIFREAEPRDYSDLSFPVIVKPTDSCGSKGVSKVDDPGKLDGAYEYALKFSRNKRVILEEYIDNQLGDVHGDGFVVDGELVFWCMGDHLYDTETNPYNPKGTVWPSQLPDTYLQQIREDVEGIIRASGFRSGPINIEARVNSRGKPYVMEIGPRSGGFFVPQAIFRASGFDMVKATLDVLEGKPIQVSDCIIKPTAYYAIHTSTGGEFREVSMAPELEPYVAEQHIYASRGERVYPYTGGNAAIGVLILTFDSEQEMSSIMEVIDELVEVKTA